MIRSVIFRKDQYSIEDCYNWMRRFSICDWSCYDLGRFVKYRRLGYDAKKKYSKLTYKGIMIVY